MQQHRSDLEMFSQGLFALAEMCQYKLSPNVVAMWVEIVKPHGLALATAALKEIAVEARPGGGFPSPQMVLNKMGKGVETDKSRAIAATDRILAAIRKFGTPSSKERTEEVFEFLGEVASAAVRERYGWYRVVQETNDCDMQTWYAQMRDTCLACIERARAGTLHTAPMLPAAKPRIDALPGVEQARQHLLGRGHNV